MEGATIRSEQGVTLSLCLVSWIDFLLHLENNKHGIAEKLPKESLTIPSIVRQLQYENMVALIEKVQNDDVFVRKWLGVVEMHIRRNRKKSKALEMIGDSESDEVRDNAVSLTGCLIFIIKPLLFDSVSPWKFSVGPNRFGGFYEYFSDFGNNENNPVPRPV
jgi:hypothetical protein